MNVRPLPLAGVVPALLIAGVGLLARQAPATPQAPTLVFRAATDVVFVNVSVSRGNRQVTGLASADFTLTDNGTSQQIDAVAVESIPLDISLLVDTSGSTRKSVDQFRRDVRAIAALLRPDDRLRLVTFSDAAHEVLSFTQQREAFALDRLDAGGATSVNDAIVAASMHRSQTGRRHLIVAITDGLDNMSVLDGASLLSVASRSDAVIHLIVAADATPMASDGSWDVWSPFGSTGRATLDQVVERSGGAVHRGSSSSSGSIVSDFRVAFEDFRSSYVLRYSPQGVRREGWHDIKVGVTRTGEFVVRARAGYEGGAR